MPTISSVITIMDPIGFHARPAGQIVKLVKDSGLEVRIGKVGDKLVKASSPLSLMALKGRNGEQLNIEVDTDDQALGDALISHIQNCLRG